MIDLLEPAINPTQRRLCTRCLRAQSTCICGCARVVNSDIECLILQHPDEVRHAKGTGRLLHLCLPNSQLIIGEQFDETVLHSALHGGGKQAVLLYPSSMGVAAWSSPVSNTQLRLVVLDATWRKSRKMLYLNPSLQSLLRLSLADTQPSHYTIRKAHSAGQLSTLEAAAYALDQLESCHTDQGNAQQLLTVLNRFVVQWQQTVLSRQIAC